MSEENPLRLTDLPAGYRCPLCSCCKRDLGFHISSVAEAAICEGCNIELSHLLELEEREQDPLLDALEAFTGVSFQEARRRYYREAIAAFRRKLQPDNVDVEVAHEVQHTKRSAEDTVAHWRTILHDYEAALQQLEAS